jgi:hypothetical protein
MLRRHHAGFDAQRALLWNHMLTSQLIFNALDSDNIAFIAGGQQELFLKVEVLPSKMVNGVPDTRDSVVVPGPDPNGVWAIAPGTSRRIRVPETAATYDFTNAGFAALRVTSVDQNGSSSNTLFIAYAAIGDPRAVAPVSGTSFIGNVFRVPLIDFGGSGDQSIQICATPLTTGQLKIVDVATNTELLPPTASTALHNTSFTHATNDATQLEVTFLGSQGVVSAKIQRRNAFRFYPARFAAT